MTWVPDWRVAKAESFEAIETRLNVILAELDELEVLLGDDEIICHEIRSLAARVRGRRNDYGDTARQLRAAIEDAV